jgi:hypothetical protein
MMTTTNDPGEEQFAEMDTPNPPAQDGRDRARQMQRPREETGYNDRQIVRQAQQEAAAVTFERPGRPRQHVMTDTQTQELPAGGVVGGNRPRYE